MFEALKKVKTPPRNPRNNAGNWTQIESALQLELPSEFKEIIGIYGDVLWGDILWLLNPFSKELQEYQADISQICGADREIRKEKPEYYPFPIYPEQNGIYPWAATENGDTLYWITAFESNKWPTVIRGPRAPEFEVSYLRPSTFLHHLEIGKLQSGILNT